MPTQVHVVVTNRIAGMTETVPYSHAAGLQTHVVNGQNLGVIYRVPSYQVRVGGSSVYTAIRFGLQNRGTVEKTRVCDAGLTTARECTPTWLPNYSPHSFRGAARRGAWQLLPGQGFLIHEGGDLKNNLIAGSLGCIEILDGNWNRFLYDIERRAGEDAASIGRDRLLRVSIEAAAYPTATLIG